MAVEPLTIAALALLLIGLLGMLIRRSVLVALMALNVSVLGAALMFCAVAIRHHDATGLANAVIVTALVVVLSLLGSAVAIAVFRRRATIHLDELRELRG